MKQTKYEYDVLHTVRERQLLEILTDYGNKSWELVSILVQEKTFYENLYVDDNIYTLIFKRILDE